MDWEQVREQLEAILNTPVQTTRWAWEAWRREVKKHEAEPGAGDGSLIREGRLLFLAQKEGQDALLLAIQADAVSPVERRLVELTLESRKTQDKKPPALANEEERKAGMVRDWLRTQQELGLTQAEMPDALVSQLSLYSKKIPLLLYGDYTTSRRAHDRELKKLLESFFDADMTLIPLTDKEWLILGSEKILSMDTGDDKEDSDGETLEDRLAAIGHGLHEMLENEWVGECHLAIHYPILPAKSLYAAVLQLRETMMLGRTYHVGSNMHMPWELQLERLVHLVPEAEKASFLEQVLKRLDVAFDAETMTTLEQFFQLDCNVSETAKKLYIHRNTLLYRLDKFKQETGLDVRTFNNAVLVKIAMLLYKVTKRK
ncbi:PucR family transcriptional regulator [Paenibacillus ehimensis]|uniref:Helix-turn-helix domain-containing protein n=1 Tax=Paenibacillus ehimensis TaxID=79264 RepID=A0ABT8V748_9BACL|nr:helix-turn-helix domain-containing protein [Paenibacillus ehimensis]MDO3677275.1 helix-turn-helix domain-containing protein [Paenibacillus ehimensis]MEC0208951.1 helix-turn-helix domain-containing protein [Paenibacillus ehimensis]